MQYKLDDLASTVALKRSLKLLLGHLIGTQEYDDLSVKARVMEMRGQQLPETEQDRLDELECMREHARAKLEKDPLLKTVFSSLKFQIEEI